MRLESGLRKGRTTKRTRYSEEQIIGILAEHEAGAKCTDLCRKHGMSEGTFYNWKARYGGMTVSDAKRLKKLQADLDAWLVHYNTERPHLGYRNMGRRPVETVMSFVRQEG